jgi:hypothetical protein
MPLHHSQPVHQALRLSQPKNRAVGLPLSFLYFGAEWMSSKTQTTNFGKDMGERNPHTLFWECKLVKPLWKTV